MQLSRYKKELHMLIEQFTHKAWEEEQLNLSSDQQAQTTSAEVPQEFHPTEPGVMDIKVVLEMFQQLKAELNNSKIPDGPMGVLQLETRQEDHEDRILNLESELYEYQTKHQILTGVVSRLYETVSEAENRIEMLEYNNMKRAVVLTGLNTDFNKKICLNEIYNFLQQE